MSKRKKSKVHSTETFIQSAKEIHGNKYDYSKSTYTKMGDKITITCPIHGDISLTSGNHIYNKQGCKQCYVASKYSNLETFTTKAKEVHGDLYDYSEAEYKGAHTKLTVICKIHGRFSIDPHHHKLGVGCYHCGRKRIIDSNQWNQSDFLRKAKEVHGDVYDYSNTIYVKSNIKVSINCPTHGAFEMTPNSHIQGQGCRLCGHDKLSLQFRSSLKDFVSKANKIHDHKYDYSKVNYINNRTKVIITCPYHGDFDQLPNVHLNGCGCLKCSSSKGEKFIAKILTENNIKYFREYRLPENIGSRHRYDFYLPQYNLLIEFHGGQHYFPVKYFGGEEYYRLIKERDLYKIALAKTTKRNLLVLNYKQLRNRRYFKWFLFKKLKTFKLI